MSTYTVDFLAALINADVINQNGVETFIGVGTLEEGQKGEIGFLAESRYQKFLATTSLSAVIVNKAYEQATCTQLVVKDVKAAWRKVVDLFADKPTFIGIHLSAIISDRAHVDANVSIDAGVTINADTTIAEHCMIGAGTIIGRHVSIGKNAYIASGVNILDNTVIGDNAYINSGAVIGSRGFGFSFENNTWQPIAQIGRVIIGDNVEIGANTTIDRGAVNDTIIGNGVKLDNLIQVGHNVVIGEHTIIAGCCVIAGSTTIGKYCMIGGASVLAGHIDICDYTQITGHSSISKSIKEPGVYSAAFPAMPNKQWNRLVANVRGLDKK